MFAAFEGATDSFDRADRQVILNFRVRNLIAMLEQLRRREVDVEVDTRRMDGVGVFGWVSDPEGNRIELFEES